MTILENIKKDQITARKNKDEVASNLLTTLIGEADMIGKNNGNRATTDAEVMALVKKFIKNIDETILILNKDDSKNETKIAALNKEKSILNIYLPTQLSQEQLTLKMKEIIANQNLTGPKSVGQLMKELKVNYDGQFDGTVASKIAKQLLV